MGELTPHLIAEITADLGLDLPGYRLEPAGGQGAYLVIDEGGDADGILGIAYLEPGGRWALPPAASRWKLGCQACLEPIGKSEGGMCLRCRKNPGGAERPAAVDEKKEPGTERWHGRIPDGRFPARTPGQPAGLFTAKRSGEARDT